MRKILAKVESNLAMVGAGCILVMMLITTADVTGRYLFNNPIPGTYELSELLLIGVVFLAVAYVQSRKSHVKVELFERHLSKRNLALLEVFGDAIGLCTFSVMAWQAGIVAWKAFQIKQYYFGVIQIPIWPGKMVFALGVGLLCVRLTLDIASDLRRVKEVPHES